MDTFPRPGTPEWGRMNQERADLIRKDVRGELTDPERTRLEYLQRESLAALEGLHP